jgi:hypothetical protein
MQPQFGVVVEHRDVTGPSRSTPRTSCRETVSSATTKTQLGNPIGYGGGDRLWKLLKTTSDLCRADSVVFQDIGMGCLKTSE